MKQIEKIIWKEIISYEYVLVGIKYFNNILEIFYSL